MTNRVYYYTSEELLIITKLLNLCPGDNWGTLYFSTQDRFQATLQEYLYVKKVLDVPFQELPLYINRPVLENLVGSYVINLWWSHALIKWRLEIGK